MNIDKKIIYLFSEVNPELGFNEQAKERILRDIINTNKITFISARPYSKEASEYKVNYIVNNFNNIGVKFNKVEVLLDEDGEELISNKLKDTSVLFLTGGNPIEQMEFIKNKNLSSYIKNFDGIVMGISAGSMNISKKVLMISVSDEYPETIIYDGLGIVPFSIFPHFNIKNIDDEIVDMGYNQKFKMSDLKNTSINCGKVYCLPDNCLIRIENNNLEVLDDKSYILLDGKLELNK